MDDTIYSLEIFQNILIEWFDNNGRDFPWRNTYDPYAIMIAEKLLQQTKARQAVVTTYFEILHTYPNFSALASADPEILKSLIRPLGLVYRAEELIATARYVIEQHGGNLPNDLTSLRGIVGIGEYSARAISCFAYHRDIAIVDTNVARFIYRLHGTEGPLPSNPARKKSLLDQAQSKIPQGRSREFNFAILDLCASICVAKEPLCNKCPVRKFCVYGSARSSS